ncbi:hypothetical protein V6N13_109240 [Hibiscus sabdariffa]
MESSASNSTFFSTPYVREAIQSGKEVKVPSRDSSTAPFRTQHLSNVPNVCGDFLVEIPSCETSFSENPSVKDLARLAS